MIEKYAQLKSRIKQKQAKLCPTIAPIINPKSPTY
jgi:hypothetical protein